MTFIDNEAPPATSRERLAAVQDQLKELRCRYDVEYVEQEQAVYVNYGFSTALVIEMGDSDTPEYDGMYVLNALHWDKTHAVDQDHYIGLLADARITAQVAIQYAREHESL